MADIAIFRINYKSDFILTLNSDAGWMTPFCIKFWTGAPSQAYFVGFDGTTYTHCAPVAGEPTKLLVQFDDHHLPIGDLKFQIGYHFTVADFPTTVEDEVLNQASVIIEVDDAPAQVMLDLNGETAPEIEFSLPAYANEAQRIANEEQRIANEEQRIANEEARIAAETIRQQNEAQRISNEESRVTEFARLKQESETATADANAAAALANEKAALADDKAALADAAATLANEKAQLAADKAALAQAAATLANEKAALAQQKAAYAQTQGDYAKAQGDYAKEQGEIAEEDHERAEADHTRAESDHTQATSDHTQAGTDHSTAVNDHTQSVTDHTQADTDHTRAESDHTQAASDHTQAGADHTRAESDHTTASADHTQAGQDHTRAESDHTRAESDHAAVEVYVDSLGAFDISAYHATGSVLAKYADLTDAIGIDGANIPETLRKGGMSVKFVQSSDNKYVQYGLIKQTWSVNVNDWQKINLEDELNAVGRDVYIDKQNLNSLDKDVFGGSFIFMPYAFTQLNWEQSSHARKVIYQDSYFLLYCNGVKSVLADQAGLEWVDNDSYMIVDEGFWDNNNERLELEVLYNCTENAELKIYYKKYDSTTLLSFNYSIPSGSGSLIIDIKQRLISETINYKKINRISIFGTLSHVSDASSYGELEIKTYGLNRIKEGELPVIDKRLVNIENEAEGIESIDLTSIAVRTEAQYINYETGSVTPSNTRMETYIISLGDYDQILSFIGSIDNVPAAIAFYSANTPSENTYLKGSSVQATVTTIGKWFCAAVPVGAKIAVVSNRKEFIQQPKILGQKSNIIQELKKGDNTPWIIGTDLFTSAVRTDHKYVVFLNGKIYTSGLRTPIEVYQIDVAEYDFISAWLASSDEIPAAIAFYSSNTPSPNTYIPSNSVQIKTGREWYAALVPKGAKCAVITNRYGMIETPIIIGGKAHPIKEIASVKDNLRLGLTKNPIKNGVLYHHLNVENASEFTKIPSQSLLDIWYAKAIGFNFIEANVQKCSDDVFVVKHGDNGKLGAGVKLVGGGDCSTVEFSNVTSTWLRENVVYDSVIAKNCITIPTLTEFCLMCKELDMGILLAAYGNTDDAIVEVRKILSDDKIIAVTPSIRGDFKGFIDGWWSINSVDEAISLHEKFGSPFILGWSNYISASQTLIDNVVAEMHKRGALVGSAYLGLAQVEKAKNDGLDVIASVNTQINPFLLGNLHNIHKLNDSALVLSSGATYEASSDTIVMTDESTVSIPNTEHANDFVKASVYIRYNGVLDIQFGKSAAPSLNVVNISNDGSKTIELSDSLEQKDGIVRFLAHGTVEIMDLTIVTSLLF